MTTFIAIRFSSLIRSNVLEQIDYNYNDKKYFRCPAVQKLQVLTASFWVPSREC